MRVVILLQRPSRWSGNGLYRLFLRRAKKRHVYGCREIARWAEEEDGKEHSPSWVNAKMRRYYRAGKKASNPFTIETMSSSAGGENSERYNWDNCNNGF